MSGSIWLNEKERSLIWEAIDILLADYQHSEVGTVHPDAILLERLREKINK